MICEYRISNVRACLDMPQGWYIITVCGGGVWMFLTEYSANCPPQIGATRYVRYGVGFSAA
jgi:hypothetical protein